jgi:hypothetical protein
MHLRTLNAVRRNAPLAAFLASVILSAPAQTMAEETLFRCPGSEGGPAVTFDFRPESVPALISLDVEDLDEGVPVVSVYLDAAVVPAFVHAYLPGECAIGPSGKRNCSTTVAGTDRRYRMLMMVFKLGREARVTLERNGEMVLRTSSPVGDFALDFDS